MDAPEARLLGGYVRLFFCWLELVQAPRTMLRGFWVVFLLSCIALPGVLPDQITSDGDIVECVDKFRQPAFENPLLKYHKLQDVPSEIPKMIGTQKGKRQTQEAYVSTTKCPDGAIPILLSGHAKNRTQPETKDYHSGHEYAIVSYEDNTKLYGTKAVLNVWDPAIEEGAAEMSLAQIWIASGDYETADLNTIEVGWQVLPQMYNDIRPRLFLFWTGNTYRSGCYNVRCSGFIQTSGSIVVGGPIAPVSSLGGIQTELTVFVWKDRKSGNWWLSLGVSIVGYWPAELFTTLADHAAYVQWGGEILNKQPLGRHTTTQMGSGHFPDEGFGRSGYFRNLEYVDYNNRLESVPVQKLGIIVTNPDCYKVKHLFSDDWKTQFYYGGPGFTHSGATLALASRSLFFVVVVLLFLIV
ncbi:uncharacterized protein LOC17881783 isoform X2 [Capsella rubella]|uniref:uncharacterized protein LOC17881783 isoform X2 n=1 Tax=Capsella rubella TaxID=81985 RepID=UPI000CD50DDD|nr:uncharacterized protein LOC17881783 isoform X2 [Capsella rubella]